MEIKEVQIFTDWALLRGNDIAESLLIKLYQDERECVDRTKLDDIVSFERSIHLQCNIENTIHTNISSTCDINFQILSKYIINTLTIITDCQKAEIFKNTEKEYVSTVYGDFLDDFDGMQVYRHDINIHKFETCTTLTVKLLPKTHKIWIYGMEIILQNNPNPFNNIGSTSINLDNVQNMLSNCNQKISPNAERCKSFIQFMTTNASGGKISPNKILGGSNIGNTQNLLSMFNLSNSNRPPNMENLMSIFNSNMDPKSLFNGNNYEDSIKINQQISKENNNIEQLKEYFDKKILDTENKMLQRIQEIEKSQNEKLDKILDILKNSTSSSG